MSRFLLRLNRARRKSVSEVKHTLNSALNDPEQTRLRILRISIADLKGEIANIHAKMDRMGDAVSARQVVLSRLEAELAMSESAPALPVMACG